MDSQDLQGCTALHWAVSEDMAAGVKASAGIALCAGDQKPSAEERYCGEFKRDGFLGVASSSRICKTLPDGLWLLTLHVKAIRFWSGR